MLKHTRMLKGDTVHVKFVFNNLTNKLDVVKLSAIKRTYVL